MNVEKYPIVSDYKLENFRFVSIGPKGVFQKEVYFQQLYHNFYNLLFGDWDGKQNKIDDRIRSNNEDRDRVLATVAYIIIEFMIAHPKAIVEIRGSTAARTRLYQAAVKKYFHRVRELFIIDGISGSSVEELKWHKNYDGFVIRHKEFK